MRKNLQHSLLLIPVLLIVFTFSYCTSQQTADNASADLKIKGNFTINIFNAEDEMVQMNKGNFTHPFNIEVKMIELRNTDMDDEISLETHSIQKKLSNVDDNKWENKHYIVNSTIYIDSIVFNGDSKKDHDFEINHHIVA